MSRIPITRANSHDAIQPLSQRLFARDGISGLKWQMTLPERCAFVQLLRAVQPRVSVEVGTSHGGSLAVMHHHTSGTVYSLDIDPTCPARLGPALPRARFITGDSRHELPRLLAELAGRSEQPQLILLDGEHSADALARDIASVLKAPIREPLHLLIHDSFNTLCREAIANAEWDANPAFEHLEIDFVPGVFHERPEIRNQLWGGLALATFDPARDPARPQTINASYAHLHESTATQATVQEGQY